MVREIFSSLKASFSSLDRSFFLVAFASWIHLINRGIRDVGKGLAVGRDFEAAAAEGAETVAGTFATNSATIVESEFDEGFAGLVGFDAVVCREAMNGFETKVNGLKPTGASNVGDGSG